MLEVLVLIDGERDRGGAAHVLTGQRVDVVRGVALVALAALVVVAREFVESLGQLHQFVHLEHEHADPLFVDEQHTEPHALFDGGFELADRRDLVDHKLVANRLGQRDHLPQVVG